MQYKFFSKNGRVLPIEQAVVSLENIAYAYGFGVYESLRLSKGVVYFAEDHIERLLESAQAIALEHSYTGTSIEQSISALAEANQATDCNIKLLLIGGTASDEAALYSMCLNPLFPDRKLYREGAKAITYEAERPFPHAKSLNMLQSYMAYREAKVVGAYDALLVNRKGHITEGTRTNFFCMKGRMIISPPEDEILLGIMRKVVLKVALENGFTLEYRDIVVDDLNQYDAAFITSTSSKIMPIKAVGSHIFSEISPEFRELMQQTDYFLANCGGRLSQA